MAAPQWNTGPSHGPGQRHGLVQISNPRRNSGNANIVLPRGPQMDYPYTYSPFSPSQSHALVRREVGRQPAQNIAHHRQNHYPTNSAARRRPRGITINAGQPLQHRPRLRTRNEIVSENEHQTRASQRSPNRSRRGRPVVVHRPDRRLTERADGSDLDLDLDLDVDSNLYPVPESRSRPREALENSTVPANRRIQSANPEGSVRRVTFDDQRESEHSSTGASDISSLAGNDSHYPTTDSRKKVQVKRIARVFEKSAEGHLKSVEVAIADGERIRQRLPHHSLTQEPSSIKLIEHYNEAGTLQYRSLNVLSESFANLLREVGNYPLHNETDGSSQIFMEPFVDVFNRLKEMREYIKNVDSTNLSQDLLSNDKVSCAEAVLDLLATDFPALSAKFDLMRSDHPPSTIIFEDLWMVYRPGSIVFSQPDGQPPFGLMIESTEYIPSEKPEGRNPKGGSQLVIHAWYLDYHETNHQYDGMFGRRDYKVTIDPFKGEKSIPELELVPDMFFEEESVRKKIKANGQKFWQLSKPSFREISLSGKQGRSSAQRERIMVDPTTNRRVVSDDGGVTFENMDALTNTARLLMSGDVMMSSRDSPDNISEASYMDLSASRSSEYDVIDPSSKPTDIMLMLCSPWIRAFSLREKLWSDYPVMNIEPVQFQEDAWSRIVINQEYKDVVQAMVNSHLRQSDQFEDLIPGKGGGVVILLHGPPGVGKTLTAESVAENTKKPLYMVTAGDLGTNPEDLEAKLSHIFKLAERWDAILLLDEADVFLQERDYDNLTRNALVSIFLRTLEYFKGVMFLTSNRVGAFDQAFQSRIHITLGIPEFTEETRKEVWKIFITDLGRKRRDGSGSLLYADECKALVRQVRDSWAREPLNGRQIRNCVRSALALAQDKGERVSAKHFMTVIKLGNMFTKYVNRTQSVGSDDFIQVNRDRMS